MKKLILPIVVLVVVGTGAFYGGMKYGQSKNSFNNLSRQNLTPEQCQQFAQNGLRRGNGAGFLGGEVLSKDQQSLTIKIQDGSSKIVFFSASTQISKTAEGSINDIEVGKQVTITGQQNSDGSYTAKTLQIRPLPQPQNQRSSAQ